MSAETTSVIPRTAREVAELLKKLSLPVPDREGFVAISRSEGTKFTEAIAKVGRSDDTVDGQMDYVQNVLAASLPTTREIFSVLEHSIEITTLIQIAKREGLSFRNAVNIVQSGSDGKNEAEAYLFGLLEEYGAIDMPTNDRGFGYATFSSSDLEERKSDENRCNLGSAKAPLSVEETPDSPAGEGNQPQEVKRKQYGGSFHIYAGKAVMCMAETLTRAEDKATVTIEVAQRTAEGKALWQGKYSLMLTVPEQPLVLGLFLGYLDKLEIKGHGSQQEKALTINNQGNQFFLTMIVRGHPPRAVPIPPEYAYCAVSMLIGQMRKNDPHMDAELIRRLSESICKMRCAERAQIGGHHV